jgi:hypothetical protein
MLDRVEQFDGVLNLGLLTVGLLRDFSLDGQRPAVSDLLERLEV